MGPIHTTRSKQQVTRVDGSIHTTRSKQQVARVDGSIHTTRSKQQVSRVDGSIHTTRSKQQVTRVDGSIHTTRSKQQVTPGKQDLSLGCCASSVFILPVHNSFSVLPVLRGLLHNNRPLPSVSTLPLNVYNPKCSR